jgi:hypothetical protein
MGFLSSIRKLFFGVESVSKSAGRKTVEKGKEVGQEIWDNTEDFVDDVKDTAVAAGKKLGEQARHGKEKAKDWAAETFEKIQDSPIVEKAEAISEKVGEKILGKDRENLKKAEEISEKVGEKVIETGKKAADKGKEVSEKVGEKILEVKDKIVDKAKEVTDKLGDKLDETIKKAEKMEAEEKANPTPEFAEKPIDLDDSLLDDTDDFFSKADSFSKGDYHSFSTEPIISKPKPEEKAEPKTVTNDKAAGFEDLDGDGDEIADDAVILDEEE